MENPDKYIEEFWINYKKSMVNYYNKTSSNKRPIDYWSSVLNDFQEKSKYKEIEHHILNYMSLYAIDLMKNTDNYDMRILITNIKRWKKISDCFINLTKTNEYYNIIFLLIDIYKSLMDEDLKDIKLIFSQIELIIIYKDFRDLIKFAFNNKKPSILTKINYYCDVNKILKEEFNIDNKSNLSFKKLLLNIHKS